MNTQPKNVYAVRTGEFVEFRASRTPLKVRVSKLTRTVMFKEGDIIGYDSWAYPIYATKDGKRKITFKQVFFVGGTVIGYTKASKFVRLFVRGIPKDTPVQLPDHHAANMLKPAWRRTHLL